MNNYTVYCHISPGGKRYVGITSTIPEKRWSRGNGYKQNAHFWRAIQLYGWDAFTHEILAQQLTYEQAADLERSLIESWDLTNPQNGYNLSKGDGAGISEETRHRMSEAQKGNKNSIGRVWSDEGKQKISKSLKQYYSTHDGTFKGRTHTDDTKKKMKQRQFSEEARAKMRKKHANVSGAKNPSAKAVNRIDPNNGSIKFYAYASLAAKELNVDLSSIIKCCRAKDKCKTAGGFIWRYANVEGKQIENSIAS